MGHDDASRGHTITEKVVVTHTKNLTSGQVRLGQVILGQVRLGQVRLGQVRLGKVISSTHPSHMLLGPFWSIFFVLLLIQTPKNIKIHIKYIQVRLGQVRFPPSLPTYPPPSANERCNLFSMIVKNSKGTTYIKMIKYTSSTTCDYITFFWFFITQEQIHNTLNIKRHKRSSNIKCQQEVEDGYESQQHLHHTD